MAENIADSGLPISSQFASPCCRRALVRKYEALECVECGHPFPIREGVYTFDMADSTHGEFSKEEMSQILVRVAELGWREALRIDVQRRNPSVVSLITDRRRRISLEPILHQHGERVLDFGCGYGGLSMLLAENFEEVVALDESWGRIALLNQIKHQDKFSNLVLVCHRNALMLPFPQDHFDSIVLCGVFEYLPTGIPDMTIWEAHAESLRELLRVLKPGGRLWLLTKNRFGWQFMQGCADNSGIPFAPLLPRPVANAFSKLLGKGEYRIVSHSRRGYQRLLAASGFADLQFYWTVPSYQAPDYIVPLDGSLTSGCAVVGLTSGGTLKRLLLRAAARMRLLSWIVPYYGVLARKPKQAMEQPARFGEAGVS